MEPPLKLNVYYLNNLIIMKKLSIIFTIIGCLSFVACKKDRVCECTFGSLSQKVTFTEATKRQAKDACVSKSYDNGNGTTSQIDCKLK